MGGVEVVAAAGAAETGLATGCAAGAGAGAGADFCGFAAFGVVAGLVMTVVWGAGWVSACSKASRALA